MEHHSSDCLNMPVIERGFENRNVLEASYVPVFWIGQIKLLLDGVDLGQYLFHHFLGKPSFLGLRQSEDLLEGEPFGHPDHGILGNARDMLLQNFYSACII